MTDHQQALFFVEQIVPKEDAREIAMLALYSDTTLRPFEGTTLDDCEKMLRIFRRERKKREHEKTTLLWWLGDLLNFLERRHPQTYSQLLDATMYEKESLGNVQRIAEAIRPERRKPAKEVSFWLYGHVYTLAEFEADELIEQYLADELTYSQVVAEARELRERDRAAGVNGSPPAVDSDSGSSAPASQTTITDHLDTCPLCNGAGSVTHDRREAYLREEATL